MFHQVLRATIAALVLLPVCAQAGPIIQYQSVTARYIVNATVVDRNAGESDGESFSTQIEPDPQDVVANAVLSGGRASSSVGLSFERDELNNTFSFDASIAAISDEQEDIYARAFVAIRMFIDFTVESDTDDLVELVFSVDGSMLGLETVATDALSSGGASLNLGSARGGRTFLTSFGLFSNNNEVSGTESFLVRPGELYSILTVVDIENRRISSDPLASFQHIDAVGNFQLTSSLAVRSVPEPWSLAMLGFGLLSIGWRRTPRLTSLALD